MLDAIIKRRSIRSYKKDEVADNLIVELVKAAQFAPNSHHNRSLEFVVVKDNKTKEILYNQLGQGFLMEAPVLLVPVIDTNKSFFPVQDIAAASENIFLQAVEFGLGTVWKNITGENIEKVKQILNIPSNFTLTNIIPVGYPKTKRRPHKINDFDLKKIHNERW